ncbi:hypothetical protein Acr_06g0001230 [Actinidia rufa]|uniref:mRNA export factor GLE1 n=1 Tax=Actinidia rufa TaxID=165716 RepID=A0A7J0ENV9_9ERIC|nr:hypothetical protein Acr_06g0001230 [Actinidia rufa]
MQARFEAEKGAEQAKAAAAAADRKAAKEAVEKVAREDSARATTADVVAPKEATERQAGASSGTLNNQSNESGSDGVVDQYTNPNKAVFAYAHVIVLDASREHVPLAMDLILAKLNRACIYTVPKYISYSKSQFDTKEAHYKAIGYMKTTERLKVKRVADVKNESIWSSSSGVGEGWAWLARFLNACGHSLKNGRRDAKLNKAITSIQTYVESNKFLEEPQKEDISLQSTSLSHVFVPEIRIC